MKVEIYSDVACPWCYVGERRFFRALDALPQADRVEVVFRPYQLDPSLPETPRPLAESLEAKFGPRLEATLRHTAAVAKQEGLDLRFDRALAVNTLAAHRLLRLALEEAGPEAQRALADRLFAAHFTDGANIADPALLADLAAEVGLDRGRTAAYLASDEGTDEVRAEIAHAQRLGIRAVPTFVFDGRYAVQGAQPTSTFLQVLEAIQQEAAASAEAATEACVDGACAV
ncbi:MAG TPA: DsbA family oxidoreductase [Rubricoccaceae bacterium]|nr:DsbA family oxidoreductase [Rubricoccaceae bacterium]